MLLAQLLRREKSVQVLKQAQAMMQMHRQLWAGGDRSCLCLSHA